MKQYLTFFLLMLSRCFFAQEISVDPASFDYSRADSIAMHFPKLKYKAYTELVAPLTAGLKTDYEKARVLFRWITDNITYNYSNTSDNADKAVKSKKAVCIGYSTLYKEMCISAGIDCEVISGYSKTHVRDIGKKYTKTDHAWNAVKLNGKWYLLDVTWASGYYDDKKNKSTKCFDPLYFLTPPAVFVTSHLPADKKWQFLDKPVKLKQFSKLPLFYDHYFSNHIENLSPAGGFIHMKLKDTLEFSFRSDIEITWAAVDLGEKQFSYTPAPVRNGNSYTLKQKFEKPGTYELFVFLNRKAIAGYKLKIR